MEGLYACATIDELKRRGHQVNCWDARNELAGLAHGIVVDPRRGSDWARPIRGATAPPPGTDSRGEA